MEAEPLNNERTARRARDRGAALVEYALLIALIAIVVVSASAFFGQRLSESFDDSGDSMGMAG
ncbi:Flp family type IVb pilin [Actinospongicola halichondriae]|uniref:Flp family type IVb pilin n=1 Tax=Actinospongicola halichondriae TaxID=3236844 RepID=UPI003D4D50D1